ncbi:MAG: 3-oxoacyl-[acyl-carrier protein] reductase [Saprospiraceae bacterium]|jgi:3-oxoacyl-[acyl-carrier protein] reductase
MLSPIRNRNVIVTGGTKGIGKGIARVFASHGANVMIAARSEKTGNEVVSELQEYDGEVKFTVCDVTNWPSVQNMMEETANAFGGIDVVCANAGMFPQTKIVDMDPGQWDSVMECNLKSSFLCVKAAIPYFEKAGKGRVVLTSSITGPVTGYPGWSHYGASKAGQLGFLKTAAIELAKYNTTINAVMPGNIYTEGLEDLGEDYLATMAASIPLKRLGSVEDIGNAALFFAADEAGYITGQQLIIDGGQILPESLEALSEMD